MEKAFLCCKKLEEVPLVRKAVALATWQRQAGTPALVVPKGLRASSIFAALGSQEAELRPMYHITLPLKH